MPRSILPACLLVLGTSVCAAAANADRTFFVYPHVGIPANPVMAVGVTAYKVVPQNEVCFAATYRYGLGQSTYSDGTSFPVLGHDGYTLKLSVGKATKAWTSEGQIIRYEGSDGWDVMRFSREKAEITNRTLWAADWWILPTGKRDANAHNHYFMLKKARLNTYHGGVEIYGERGLIMSSRFNQLGIWAGFSGCHVEFDRKVPALGHLINEVGMGAGIIRRFDKADTGWIVLWELTWGPALPDFGF